MFKVSKKEEANKILFSSIKIVENNIKFLNNPTTHINKKFTILKNNCKRTASSSDEIKEMTFALPKNRIQKLFLAKKKKIFFVSCKHENKKMFFTKRILIDSGRWSKNEKLKFLEGFYKFGYDWKKVKNNVSSRTGKQIRSHAQKFLLSLRKFKDDSLGIDFTNNIYNDREKLLNKFRKIIDDNESENMLVILNNKLSKKNLLSEKNINVPMEDFDNSKYTNKNINSYSNNSDHKKEK